MLPNLTRPAWVLLACCAWGGVAKAAPVRFDLPAQAASSALLAFAKQAGVEVLFSFEELKSVQSSPVIGVLEPGDAITQLLRGTGFTATRNSAGKFVVVSEQRRKRTGELTGRVVADSSGAPVAGAWVGLAGTTAGVRTRTDGSFRLTDVPVEPQSLLLHADGFATTRVAGVSAEPQRARELGTIRLTAGDDVQELEEVVVNASELRGTGPPAFVLEEVVVTPSRFGIAEERGPIAAMLTESDLLALPQLGDDLYRAISRLPGLAADDMTARFWVRGAPHDQVLARLDGVDLIEPFHMKETDSSLSIVDLETISRLNLYTAGFTTEYGDRLAGVLAMETDSPVRPQPRTTLGLSMTGARAANRGATSTGRSRWLASVRSGYPEMLMKLRNANNGAQFEPRYYDVFGKWETSVTPNHTLAVHALHSGDRMTFSDENGTTKSEHTSSYLWARWTGEFGAMRGEAVVSAMGLDSQRVGVAAPVPDFDFAMMEERTMRNVALRHEWTANWRDQVLWRTGMELKQGAAQYDYIGSYEQPVFRDGAMHADRHDRELHTDPAGSTAGGFFAVRIRPRPDLTLEPGTRYDWNDYAGDSDVSPRLNAAWTRGTTTWRAAWGIYHQAQGLQQLAVQDGEATFHSSERAEQRVLSVEHRFPAGINLRLEGYQRVVDRPQPHWANVINNLDVAPEFRYDRIRLNPIEQRARGVELIVERRGGELAWSGSYALAESEETLENGVTVPRARDQRHTIYLDATYTPNPRWQFSVAWQFHTGWPTTALNFELVSLAAGGVGVINRLGSPYGTRLPNYHRLDLRVQRRFALKHGVLRAYVDIFNVYDRENVLTYNYSITVPGDGSMTVERKRGDSLIPLIPSVGVTWDF